MAKPKVVKEKEKEAVEETKKEEVAAPIVKDGFKRVKVTLEELMKLQADKKIIGYDPATSEAIFK